MILDEITSPVGQRVEIPSTKFQIPNKFQLPNVRKIETPLTPSLSPKGRGGRVRGLNFGHWVFGHCLVLGFWNLVIEIESLMGQCKS